MVNGCLQSGLLIIAVDEDGGWWVVDVLACVIGCVVIVMVVG